MKKALEIMDKVFEILTFVNMILMFGTVFIQVFSRLALPKAPAWTEELARLFFIGAIAFAAPLCMKYKQFVVVDIFVNLIPKKIMKFINIFTTAIVVIFMAITAFYSVKFTILGAMQTAPVTSIIMAIPFSAMLITTATIFIYGIIQILDQIKQIKDKGI